MIDGSARTGDLGWADALRRELRNASGVSESTSRFGLPGRFAWLAGKREIAHLHARPLVDIRLPAKARAIVAHDPRLVPRAGRSEWIECRMETAADALFVAQLICSAAAKALQSRGR